MSDQKKNPSGGLPSNAPLPGLGGKLGGLPGLGNKPSSAPLPGLGNKPSSAPLPGLGGRPSSAPLPGLGTKPGGAAPLPGLGAKPGAAPAPLPGLGAPQQPVAAPPFMQQPEPAAPQGPSEEQLARDPFGPESAPVAQPGVSQPAVAMGPSYSEDPSVQFSAAEAGRSRKPLIIGLLVVGLIGVLLGFMGGRGASGRVALNIAIRDALIIEWEIKQAAALLDELQAVINSAAANAAKKSYDDKHIAFLEQKMKGNPIPPTVFTDRNYKTFEVTAVNWLTDFYNKWSQLDKMVQRHRQKSRADEKVLKTSGAEFAKLLQTQYGVVFHRDKNKNGQLTADLVLLGPCENKRGKNTCSVQVGTGTAADDRELYNPEAESKEAGVIAESPTNYVMAVGDNSKAGLLKNASQSHFNEYAKRLQEMSQLLGAMTKIKDDLLGQMAAICSQDPVSIGGGLDPEEELDKYIATRKGSGDKG